MKITVVYQYYQSDLFPGHSLIFDWTQQLAKRGHQVTVVAGETGYMQSNQKALPWYRRFFRKEQLGQVAVYRTFTYAKLHRGYFHRLLNYLSFSLSAPLALLFMPKPEVVLASSPPIFPIFSSWVVCKLRRIPFMLEVRDLWPDSAVQMGVLKNRILVRIMGWMEAVLYQQAQHIVALTSGIQRNIVARGWSARKVSLITCGVNTDNLYPDEACGLQLKQQLGIAGKSVVLYFGALGEANNIPVILRAAERLKQIDEIVFLLVGDGMKSAEIAATIKSKNLTNVRLLPAVPKHQARAYLNASSICLVTLLDIPLFRGALPTKLFDYMACGKPILCGVGGEAQAVLEQARSGYVFPPNDDARLAVLIQDLLGNPAALRELGSPGVAFVHNNYSAALMCEKIESVLCATSEDMEMIGGGGGN